MNEQLLAIAQAMREARKAAHQQLQDDAAYIAVLGIDMAIERIADTFLDPEVGVEFRERTGWNTSPVRIKTVKP